MKVEYISVNNILLDENSYENILVCNILDKKFMNARPLRITFDKVNGLIKIHSGIRYLELSDSCYKQIFHAFLFNMRNYLPEVINIQRREVEVNIIF